VATDALVEMEKAMARDGIHPNDKQLACARITSQEGQDYLAAMAAAANYAWVNRSSMTFLTRQTFAKAFGKTPDELDMHLIYDVSHNIAKIEEHVIDGKIMKVRPSAPYCALCWSCGLRVFFVGQGRSHVVGGPDGFHRVHHAVVVVVVFSDV
jgi:hypothetical protein